MNHSIGPLIMIDIVGRTLRPEERAFIAEHQIRAICLFRRNLGTEAEIIALTSDLRQLMGPLCLIAIDQEGGGVVRATSLPQPPSALALTMGADRASTQAVGAAVARGVASLGFNWNFAPVLDVNNNPMNPVIAERSFGARPDTVIDYAGAWMQGALEEGVAACVKHFPGHGDTAVDSHFDLPVVDKSLSQLTELELAPFYALRHHAPAMMTAHIRYPQLDAVYPATLSRPILHTLLREEWGYQGVVITDSLSMKAIHDHYSYAQSGVLALQAGADMVMVLGTLDEQKKALHALTQAHQDGQFSAADLSASKARIDALAQRFPATTRPYPAAQRQADETLMASAWAAGLSTLGVPKPPEKNQILHVFMQGQVDSNGVSESGVLVPSVQALFEGFAVHWHICPNLKALEAAEIAAQVGGRKDNTRLILVSNYHERYGANAAQWPFDLHLVLWNPFIALDLKAPALVSFGFGTGALQAVQAWLKGQITAPNTWSVGPY